MAMPSVTTRTNVEAVMFLVLIAIAIGAIGLDAYAFSTL